MSTVTASSSVEDAVNRRSGDLIALSHDIHAEPELAFAEHRSCAKTRTLVAERGFDIVDGPGGLDTAFRAEYGSGDLVIGICAEYDALPEIGHACGHNIIAASAVGTALALAEVADELGLTVVLIGTGAAACVTLFDFRGRRTLEWALLLPLAVPGWTLLPVMRTVALAALKFSHSSSPSSPPSTV